MAWDDDDKKGNPWQKHGDKGPADLDTIVKEFQKKLSGLLGSGGRGRGGNGTGGGGSGLGRGVIGAILVAVLVIWGLTGVYTVDEAERGIVLRFGKYTATKLPGLRWHLPWPIEKVVIVNTDRTERYDYRGESMLTEDENIVIVDLTVQYRRTDPEKYLFSLREPVVALEDVTASAIREVVGKNNLDFIITEGRAEIAEQTQELLQSTLDAYGTGITIYQVNLQEANFPAQVEGAVQDAIRAREDRQRSILAAEAYANQILPRARGQAARQVQDAEAYRARVTANAQGEADRFLDLLGEYQKAPEVTRQRIYIQTLGQILENSTKVILDTKNGNNLVYLPLDQLIKQRSSSTSDNNDLTTLPSSGSSTPPSSATPARSSR